MAKPQECDTPVSIGFENNTFFSIFHRIFPSPKLLIAKKYEPESNSTGDCSELYTAIPFRACGS